MQKHIQEIGTYVMTNITNPSERILVIDDSEDMRDFIQTLLEGEGYVVETAVDGLSALTLLADIDVEVFDLILCDLVMPEMTGFQLVEQLKSSMPDYPAKICFVTAKRASVDVDKAKSIGCDGYIVKPIDTQKLLSKVEQLFDSQQEKRFIDLLTDIDVHVIDNPFEIQLNITKLSESNWKFISPIKLKEGAHFKVAIDPDGVQLNELFPLSFEVDTVQGTPGKFVIEASLFGADESKLEIIRSWCIKQKIDLKGVGDG